VRRRPGGVPRLTDDAAGSPRPGRSGAPGRAVRFLAERGIEGKPCDHTSVQFISAVLDKSDGDDGTGLDALANPVHAHGYLPAEA
jgi:hypothetical protein